MGTTGSSCFHLGKVPLSFEFPRSRESLLFWLSSWHFYDFVYFNTRFIICFGATLPTILPNATSAHPVRCCLISCALFSSHLAKLPCSLVAQNSVATLPGSDFNVLLCKIRGMNYYLALEWRICIGFTKFHGGSMILPPNPSLEKKCIYSLTLFNSLKSCLAEAEVGYGDGIWLSPGMLFFPSLKGLLCSLGLLIDLAPEWMFTLLYSSCSDDGTCHPRWQRLTGNARGTRQMTASLFFRAIQGDLSPDDRPRPVIYLLTALMWEKWGTVVMGADKRQGECEGLPEGKIWQTLCVMTMPTAILYIPVDGKTSLGPVISSIQGKKPDLHSRNFRHSTYQQGGPNHCHFLLNEFELKFFSCSLISVASSDW